MELKDTVDLMLSNNYEDRLKAEVYQLQIRIEKLEDTIVNPKAFSNTLVCQLNAMKNYLSVLKHRATIEGININEKEN